MPDGTPDRILEKELVFEDESTEAPALELRARCMVTDADASRAAGQVKCSAEARMMGKGAMQTEEIRLGAHPTRCTRKFDRNRKFDNPNFFLA
jgi:hypothetical protein